MRYSLALLSLWGGLAVAAGCASGPDVVVEPNYVQHPARLVLIPEPKNDSPDMDAPSMVQNHIISHMGSKGYSVVGAQQTNATLATKNIKEGGQIDSMTSKQLGELFGSDYILYANIAGFSTTTLVAYTEISVDLEFRLVRAGTNETVWECQKESGETTIAVGRNLGEALAVGLADTVAAALTPYEPYVDESISYCLATLPDASGQMPEKGCMGP